MREGRSGERVIFSCFLRQSKNGIMLRGGREREDEEGTEEGRPHRLVKHPARQSLKRRPYASGKRKRNLRCENGSEIYVSRNGPSWIRCEEEEKDEEIPTARGSP